jgi:hypothetical protein
MKQQVAKQYEKSGYLIAVVNVASMRHTPINQGSTT